MKNRQWQGEDGNTRYSTEVHVTDFTFLTTKKDAGANDNSSVSITPKASNDNSKPVKAPAPLSQEAEDDLPF